MGAVKRRLGKLKKWPKPWRCSGWNRWKPMETYGNLWFLLRCSAMFRLFLDLLNYFSGSLSETYNFGLVRVNERWWSQYGGPHHQNLGHCCFYIFWTVSQILSYGECSCAPKGLRTVNLSTWSHVQPFEHRNVFVFHLSHIQKKPWELQEWDVPICINTIEYNWNILKYVYNIYIYTYIQYIYIYIAREFPVLLNLQALKNIKTKSQEAAVHAVLR